MSLFFLDLPKKINMGRVLEFRKVHEHEALFSEFGSEVDFERAVRRHLRQSIKTVLTPALKVAAIVPAAGPDTGNSLPLYVAGPSPNVFWP